MIRELYITHIHATISSFFQLGTLGAGNHYAEIQVVDEIFDKYAAKTMGLDRKGQVCIMIHCGSRGLGHQVATGELDSLSLNYFYRTKKYRTKVTTIISGENFYQTKKNEINNYLGRN